MKTDMERERVASVAVGNGAAEGAVENGAAEGAAEEGRAAEPAPERAPGSGVGAGAAPHAALVARLRAGMARGVLSFPLTSFHPDGSLDLDSYRAYLRAQLATGPGALFPACGTGEFGALDEEEYEQVVAAAVEVADGRVPVVAGTGYGWAQALRFARAAERAGADALLLLPPYLAGAAQAGLLAHVRRIAEGTGLPLIAYQRDHVTYTAATLRELAALPGVIGLKDGHSDLDRLQRLTLAAPEGFLFFNGAATAEVQARAYAAVGVPAYSSAVHAFAPEIAGAFFAALGAGEHASVDRLLRGFYVPFVELRDRQPGYAVSLVKAAARLRGRPVGPVRAPLTEPGPDDLAALEALLRTGLALVGAAPDSLTDPTAPGATR